MFLRPKLQLESELVRVLLSLKTVVPERLEHEQDLMRLLLGMALLEMSKVLGVGMDVRASWRHWVSITKQRTKLLAVPLWVAPLVSTRELVSLAVQRTLAKQLPWLALELSVRHSS
jgi:hypothetical protein